MTYVVSFVLELKDSFENISQVFAHNQTKAQRRGASLEISRVNNE